ncbi:MAG TPA: hypothetical protein DEH78_14315 [Solibacterales bacterium]|nr:hypothetical protein [Bryobacterales bacterium]
MNAERLDKALRAAGLNIHGCSSGGRIDWISQPTQSEETLAASIVSAQPQNDAPDVVQVPDSAVDAVLAGTATAADVREVVRYLVRTLRVKG